MKPRHKAPRAFREGQIAACLWAGLTTAPEIAAQLGLSVRTVERHLRDMATRGEGGVSLLRCAA